MVEPSGTFHISGGQQNFGGANPSFSQTNHYHSGHTEEFRQIVALLRGHLEAFADPGSAREQIAVIERGLARGTATDRPAVRDALEGLAGQVSAGTTIAEAIEKAISVLTEHWPF